jgi:DNA-binding transcriptional regulator YiaG
MTKDELKERQAKLGLSNRALADLTKRTEQSVSNWRTGRQAIPDYVGVLLAMAEQQASAA